jgi:hypothetical protein
MKFTGDGVNDGLFQKVVESIVRQDTSDASPYR